MVSFMLDIFYHNNKYSMHYFPKEKELPKIFPHLSKNKQLVLIEKLFCSSVSLCRNSVLATDKSRGSGRGGGNLCPIHPTWKSLGKWTASEMPFSFGLLSELEVLGKCILTEGSAEATRIRGSWTGHHARVSAVV